MTRYEHRDIMTKKHTNNFQRVSKILNSNKEFILTITKCSKCGMPTDEKGCPLCDDTEYKTTSKIVTAKPAYEEKPC